MSHYIDIEFVEIGLDHVDVSVFTAAGKQFLMKLGYSQSQCTHISREEFRKIRKILPTTCLVSMISYRNN